MCVILVILGLIVILVRDVEIVIELFSVVWFFYKFIYIFSYFGKYIDNDWCVVNVLLVIVVICWILKKLFL